jgi:hypothetical protein
MAKANRHTYLIVTTLQDVLGIKHPVCHSLRKAAKKDPTSLHGKLYQVIDDLVKKNGLANLEEGEVLLDRFGSKSVPAGSTA